MLAPGWRAATDALPAPLALKRPHPVPALQQVRAHRVRHLVGQRARLRPRVVHEHAPVRLVVAVEPRRRRRRAHLDPIAVERRLALRGRIPAQVHPLGVPRLPVVHDQSLRHPRRPRRAPPSTATPAPARRCAPGPGPRRSPPAPGTESSPPARPTASSCGRRDQSPSASSTPSTPRSPTRSCPRTRAGASRSASPGCRRPSPAPPSPDPRPP